MFVVGDIFLQETYRIMFCCEDTLELYYLNTINYYIDTQSVLDLLYHYLWS